MEVITFQSEVYKDFISKIEGISNRLSEKEKSSADQWLDNAELMQLLKISKRTAQTYRDNGLISFSQVGSKIYYRRSDVEALLAKHYVKAYKQ